MIDDFRFIDLFSSAGIRGALIMSVVNALSFMIPTYLPTYLLLRFRFLFSSVRVVLSFDNGVRKSENLHRSSDDEIVLKIKFPCIRISLLKVNRF